MKKKFEEAHALNDVATFHETYQLPILDKPQIPEADRCQLRVNLLAEELDELKEAIEDKDIVEVADALADLQYVLSGAILEFGLADRFKAIFDEVQRSNMSKTCSSIEVAKQTQKHYKDKDDVESYVVEKDGRFIVYRNGDHKVLKSVNYSPADIKSKITVE